MQVKVGNIGCMMYAQVLRQVNFVGNTLGVQKDLVAFQLAGFRNCTFVYCEVSENKDLSSMLLKALEGAIILESFLKTTVDVFTLVLESVGSMLHLLVVELYGMVASVSIV
ncbi:unnamed protein product [Fraxinus pennsylvanica]|uniref:Uncharacterized protein n=1 Tax=Fraxinus pennsylvanica TaxID=56036 RepID=A0AAD1ZP72_9LAMI|nr:unnamed protein product [Fraxinus pennsylvanica]